MQCNARQRDSSVGRSAGVIESQSDTTCDVPETFLSAAPYDVFGFQVSQKQCRSCDEW